MQGAFVGEKGVCGLVMLSTSFTMITGDDDDRVSQLPSSLKKVGEWGGLNGIGVRNHDDSVGQLPDEFPVGRGSRILFKVLRVDPPEFLPFHRLWFSAQHPGIKEMELNFQSRLAVDRLMDLPKKLEADTEFFPDFSF